MFSVFDGWNYRILHSLILEQLRLKKQQSSRRWLIAPLTQTKYKKQIPIKRSHII